VLFTSFAHSEKLDSALIGIHVNSLSDLRIDDRSFTVDFWVWFNFTDDSLKIQDALEVPNAKSVEFSNFSVQKKGGINWGFVKCRAVVNKEWDVSAFPFDHQQLPIRIEHSYYDIKGLRFVIDSKNSKIDTAITLREWKIDSLAFFTANKTYNTTFGDPTLSGSSTYPAVTAVIYLDRQHSWQIFFKMLTGVYVAFLIVLVAFFVKPADRLGLCVGGLFAAVGNKYIVESIVPSTVSNTLFDNIHNLTFVSILAVLIFAVISFKWSEKSGEAYIKKRRILDTAGFLFVLILYIVFNILLVNRAIS
jgi:hypothetical protein